MRSKLKLIVFLIFCALTDTASVVNKENTSTESKNFFDSIKQLISWTPKDLKDDVRDLYEQVKKEKEEVKKRIENTIKKEINEIDDDDDEDDFGDEQEFVRHYLKKIENTKDDLKRRALIDQLIQIFKNKYQNKVDKLLLQEAILCKINESVDDFDHLDNIRSNLEFGDIIEFKRVGYSHFSIYLGNNKLLQFETPAFPNNISVRNVFSNFPSLTLIKPIDETSHGDPVRVNNKLRLNLPVNTTEMEARIKEALSKNATQRYNVFLKNCEHFATQIRFGFGFSDQIEGLIKVAKDITFGSLRKISYDLFKTVNS